MGFRSQRCLNFAHRREGRFSELAQSAGATSAVGTIEPGARQGPDATDCQITDPCQRDNQGFFKEEEAGGFLPARDLKQGGFRGFA